jgi:hypothetical protein
MTRKHFQAIAEAIRQNINDAVTRRAVAQALIPALQQANANFNVQRFIDACVGAGGV